ncbi:MULTISPECIES: M24 family metallopeptidase [Shouchella]|uniref:Xaa-Pro peptidase family protein n=2 Tax=Shouchella TaxID=2893057 RepID=A0ABY7W4W0_9BACI|nr:MULTISPECIES: Xaa-Pro peptidase family protein [Shouchella]MED4127527.1 Xaa-Pro peptidase family protein [Shouchella miscanthi]WDF03968.1 Xaa-Pro peptidase family protein [Shouchella hunanensis]GAF22651.1 aminopeptidase YpdF [Bacillus sp. JCM 19047]
MTIIQSLQKKLRDHDVDGFLIMSPINRRYVTGFTGTAGAVLLTETDARFITDFRYVEQAEEQVHGFQIVKQAGTLMNEIAVQSSSLGIKKLGFEKTKLTYAEYEQLEQTLTGATLVAINQMVEPLRLIKTPEEIQTMKKAADIAEKAYAHIQTFIKPGIKEIDVSNELEFFMRKQGAVSSSFDIIVASGVRSALPHGVASEKTIESGELVTLDFGAYYEGYCSDITRTLAVGNISDELKTIYETVRVAQQLGIDGIKPGMTGKEADALTRDYIKEKGYGDYFGHSTGHGLGMEVHEAPGLSMASDVPLQPGMVVTVEPGIYIPGVGGTRIEDDILITETGNERLNYSSKELIIL